MTDDEIQAMIKARLKEEGIDSDEKPSEQPSAPVMRRARPPASIDSISTSPVVPSADLPSDESNEDVFDALSMAEQKSNAENKIKEEEKNANDKLMAAGAGAATGAFLRYKGVSSDGNLLSPGRGVFQPSEASMNQTSQIYNSISEDMKARQAALDKIDDQIRQITRSPTASSGELTQEQINRILQGGDGSTMGTTGAQRGFGYQGEQQRRARVQSELEGGIRSANPNLPDPIVGAGQVVPLRSGIQVPTATAAQIAQDEASRQAMAQRQQLELQRQSEMNRMQIGQDQLNQEMKLNKSRGFRAGAGKIGMGTAGGALTGLDILNALKVREANKKDPKNNRPLDWTDFLALGGGPLATFGGKYLGPLGLGMQLPYAFKHSNEVAAGMGMGDINPTTFGGGEALDPAFPEYRR
jgi:hypothetical protein